MKHLTIFTCIIATVLNVHLALGSPLAPMATMTIRGKIEKISSNAQRNVMGRPGLSGSAGADRTIPVHYQLTLTDTKVASNGDGLVPFETGKLISLQLNHREGDGYLKAGTKIRIVNYRMNGDEGGIRTSYQDIVFLDAEEPADPPGGIRLLPGFAHRPLQGIDSVVGEIVHERGMKISYEIGHVSKPGEPRVGGGFRDRAKLTPKDDLRWYREQTISGQPVHLAFRKDNTLQVSFPKTGANFHTVIGSSDDFADAMLTILSYPQQIAVAAEPAADKPAGKLLDATAAATERFETSSGQIGYRSTLIFYTFNEEKVVLRLHIDNKNKEFPISAIVEVFADDATPKGLDKWLNNQHSDGLYPDVPRPTKSHKIPAASCKIVSSKLLNREETPFGTFDNYTVTFEITDVAEIGKLGLKKFTDKATVRVKSK